MKRFMIITMLYGECISAFFHTEEAARIIANGFKEKLKEEEVEVYEYHESTGYQRMAEQEEKDEDVQI